MGPPKGGTKVGGGSILAFKYNDISGWDQYGSMVQGLPWGAAGYLISISNTEYTMVVGR